MVRIAFGLPNDEPAFPATNRGLLGSIVGPLIRHFTISYLPIITDALGAPPGRRVVPSRSSFIPVPMIKGGLSQNAFQVRVVRLSDENNRVSSAVQNRSIQVC